ncbi:helix-turn-helix transcriptional regulator [Devosia sp.]|uniref:helix-turn-helix transcriptional regulator n=1 Tax=Devosia sp. TaxID=1871048 RepID=UPI003977C557
MQRQTLPAQQVNSQVVLPAEGWVRQPTVLKLVPISKSTMWAWIRSGKFPAPSHLGPRVSAWSVPLLVSYLQNPENWGGDHA